ncbi:MAG: tRNA uridine-5-carboxymethylaminomethyl(34) synthesis GTPase MnmE [Flavobacteriales bacterium]|nr:tRNA uridine-5-carboxymethylaminomethyl(34) synthesis GTPase MnmE [Flavobacteriales bacterium]
MREFFRDDTICAISTAPGVGAIALIRLSGPQAIHICDQLFSRDLHNRGEERVFFGVIRVDDRMLDEVVVTLFPGPHSYTGEDTVEIACHGSTYIQEQVLKACLQRGARLAQPGEYTMRAFQNGKMDLSQAEAVADLIASESEAAHGLAMNQVRGGFSKEINSLRQELIDFASLIELELDFSEEDVEFADRQDLKDLVDRIVLMINKLLHSFATGNVVKKGVPVAIIGAPNMGKSTLLNALLNEERAIVSDIAGTTRDTVEDTLVIDGIQFRFIDTAGIRETEDEIESKGIQRSWDKAREASVVLHLADARELTKERKDALHDELREKGGEKQVIVLANKCDLMAADSPRVDDVLYISAKSGEGLSELQNRLTAHIKSGLSQTSQVVTNIRHYEALQRALESLTDVRNGLNTALTGDFLAIDIRKALYHLGEITGEITADDLLGNIFGRFCIGK